jgi:hypothetical protein
VYFKSDKTQAIDTQALIESSTSASDLLTLCAPARARRVDARGHRHRARACACVRRFFTIVGVIAMIMCFFILWLSFNANVHENAWEFGVLRAVGLSVSERCRRRRCRCARRSSRCSACVRARRASRW